ncbi:MAG: methyltransferase domain-containing protein [Deltaproteobacteria bacterium]|jgi:SAM-dependent methyltransferase|nr:methyltransferase domain-containing protein [Deltaproteobacteria bacterium]
MSAFQWNHQSFMELSRNFWTLRAVQAAVELGLFTALDKGEGGKTTVGDLAKTLGADGRGLGMLVTALTALGLLVRDDQGVGLTPEAARYLSENSGEYYGHALIHQANIMPAWLGLAEAVKTGQRVTKASAAESGSDKTREDFLMAMYNNARYQAATVAKALDLGSRNSLLDLGGGPGTYAIEFCLQNPNLSAVIFDLPGSEPVAKKIMAKMGVADRVKFVAGDYNQDPLPKPFDAVFISQVIHQESPQGAAALVAKAAGVLEKGGFLAIQDLYVDNDLTGPVTPALFSLNMLVNTIGGQAYTFAQVEDLMKKAGLSDIGLASAKLPPGCAIMMGIKA